MKDIKNTVVLAAVTYNGNTAEGAIPFTLITLVNESGLFELPYCYIKEEGDMREQLLDSFYQHVEVDKTTLIEYEQLKSIGAYSIESDSHLEIVNAFMVILDGKPLIRKKDGDKTPVWMNLDFLEHQTLFGNHNRIISDLQEKLLEKALNLSADVSMGEETKQAIVNKYFPKEKELRQPWIKRLQKCGLNIYEFVHPGVAIDLVIFGYKKAEKGRRDELSVLLTRRKKDDNLSQNENDIWADTWSLPGTFLRKEVATNPQGKEYPGLETVRKAAKRVAKEKAGIEIGLDDVLYDLKPLVHHSRMGWALRDGSPVITLPVFLPIAYSEVDTTLSTATTSECRWFPIRRRLWTVDKELEGGVAKVALRGGVDGPQRLNEDGTFSPVTDVMDDITTIAMWRPEDIPFLRSPEEVGLPAADAYIQAGQFVIDYYQTIIRPHTPLQDKNYDKNSTLPKDIELLTADHANIIISALHEISGNTKRTLHIVSKLLSGGIFAPAEIKRVLETWFFPWAFSRSNMQKKLRDTNRLIQEMPDEKRGTGKSRSWSYRFVGADEIDAALLDNKPF